MKNILGFLSLMPFLAFAYVSPGRPTGFINDYAVLLTDSQRLAIEEKLNRFSNETTNEIVVVTLPDLGGDTVENFAVRLFEEWGIGKAKKDNGTLLLISRGDRQIRIEVGYGLEGILTDAQSFRIIDNVIKPAFLENKYYEGINGALDQIIAAVQQETPLSQDRQNLPINLETLSFFGFLVLFFVVFFIRFLALLFGSSESWWAGGVVGGIAGLILGILAESIIMFIFAFPILIVAGLVFDFMVSRSYLRARSKGKFPWWWLGGGGFGGGSGGRGGGGFGGFGGFGGGRSGGGGASGRW